jgi:GR25 family glycosyltransferase involved in LPS biosynthesis
MRNFVITIRDNEKSEDAAQRCVMSGERFGMDIEFYEATTPINTDVYEALNEKKIPVSGFQNNKFSREDNTIAAFLSHHSIWEFCADTGEEVTIFEHDAILVDQIPDLDYNGCISFGKPSYGNFNNPPNLGKNRLVSKRYFPGAHAYRMKPNAAKVLIETARFSAQPTDVYLNIERFPFLEEYYPWPVEVRETFTTIQNTTGCAAKHMYNDNYVIEELVK